MILQAQGFFALQEDASTSSYCFVHFSTARREGESDMILKCKEGCIRNRKRVKEESEEMVVF
jgi:hypothetical protein